MAPGSAARSRASLVAAQAMPIIAEDDSVAPAVPKRAASRRILKPVTPAAIYNYNYTPFSKRSPTDSTAPTSSSSDGTLPDRKPEHSKSEEIHRQEWLARRGGWYRIIVIAFVLIAVIVGLSVGLTLGLRKKNSSSTAPDALSYLFPAGNYTLTTALSSVSTSCSSSPKTWRCYPYTLYSPLTPTSNASSATFFWTITPKTAWTYSISSTPNPFAPSFSDLPLTLLDANSYTERLTFNFSLSHSSVVDGPLVPNNPSTTTCWFNSTVMAVTLWTRMRADYPAGIESVDVPLNSGTGPAFATWPYRVEIRETQAGGGTGVPDCRDPKGNEVGGGGLGGEGECGCFYRNFELDEGAAGNNGTATNVNGKTASAAAASTTASRTSSGTAKASGTPFSGVTGRASGRVGRTARTDG